MIEYQKHFSIPTMVAAKFPDDIPDTEGDWDYGIAYKDEFICGCCGSVFDLNDAEKIFELEEWVQFDRGIRFYADQHMSAYKNCSDETIVEFWEMFADIPINPETEETEEQFLFFPIGTDKEEIWHWFDEHIPVHRLLYELDDVKEEINNNNKKNKRSDT